MVAGCGCRRWCCSGSSSFLFSFSLFLLPLFFVPFVHNIIPSLSSLKNLSCFCSGSQNVPLVLSSVFFPPIISLCFFPCPLFISVFNSLWFSNNVSLSLSQNLLPLYNVLLVFKNLFFVLSQSPVFVFLFLFFSLTFPLSLFLFFSFFFSFFLLFFPFFLPPPVFFFFTFLSPSKISMSLFGSLLSLFFPVFLSFLFRFCFLLFSPFFLSIST